MNNDVSLDAGESLEPGDDIEFITDGDGLVVIGSSTAVERFSAQVQTVSRELDLAKLRPVVSHAGSAAQTAAEISTQAGRWMKLTEESARAAQTAQLVQRSGGAFVQATTRGANGQFVKNLEFVAKPGAMLTNPAILAGVGGLMAQYAMQQTLDEITEYLAVIDAKVDDILRSQKDAVFADMIGVELVIDEAMVVRAEVGRVSEVTWSKVQGASMTVARIQGYALRQLDSVAEKLENERKISEIAQLSLSAKYSVQEWLAVLARCFQLQEALGILELDRIFVESPGELDTHRIALQKARSNRRHLIVQTTQTLLARMHEAAGRANAKVLLNPGAAKTVVASSNKVTANIIQLHHTLGLESENQEVEARRWSEAAIDARDGVLEAGKSGLEAVGRFGGTKVEKARMSTGRFAEKVANKLQRTDGETGTEKSSGV